MPWRQNGLLSSPSSQGTPLPSWSVSAYNCYYHHTALLLLWLELYCNWCVYQQFCICISAASIYCTIHECVIMKVFTECEQTYSAELISCTICEAALVEFPTEHSQTYSARLVILRNSAQLSPAL